MWIWSRRRRRERLIRRRPLPAERWRTTLEATPMLAALDDDERRRLHDLCVVFLHEKRFEGCGGLVVDESMRLWIAAQACLLVLELGVDAYRGFSTILIYPREFVAPLETEDEHGFVVEDHGERLGESWEGGPVILNWADAGDSFEDGFNLVIHEFAHKLDELTGAADGEVPAHEGHDPAAWRRDFAAAMAELAEQERRGREPAIDPYAADSPEEAFAVFSEHFFETPDVLYREFPAVHGHLSTFYRQDPRARLRKYEAGLGATRPMR